MKTHARRPQYQLTTERIRPLAIVISNDPELRAEDFPSKRAKYPRGGPARGPA